MQVTAVKKVQKADRGDQRSIYFRIDAQTVIPILSSDGRLDPETTDRDAVAAQAAALQALYLVALHNMGLIDAPRAKWLAEECGFELRGGNGNLPMNAALAVALAATRQMDEVRETIDEIDRLAEEEGWKEAVKYVNGLEQIV